MSDLIQALEEALAYRRGELKLSERKISLNPEDIIRIRENFALSQSEFANLFGVSVRTLQQWEQGRRSPHGAACTLMKVIEKHPEAVLDSMKH